MLDIITEDCSTLLQNIDISYLENKKILVVGSTGLIGINFLATLQSISKDKNIDIYCWINNDIDPIIQPLFETCKVLRGDLTNYKMFENLKTENNTFDIILHAAGYGQPNKFMIDTNKTIALNTTATMNLFSLLRIGGKFIYLSSSEVYSGLDHDQITETEIGNTNTNHIRSCYIEGKRCGESICFSNLKNFDVKIIRLSLAYGPGTKKDDQRVLNDFFRKAIINRKIDLLDFGNAYRTYIYVTDVIEMLFNIMLHSKEVLYNIGGISRLSILDLANAVGSLCQAQVILPENSILQIKGNPKNVSISIARYNNEFNKKSFVSIKDGLHKTFMWQRRLYEI